MQLLSTKSFLSVCLLSLLTSCFSEKKEIKAQEPTLRVVNVLSKEAYDDAHIKGSINVPFDTLIETAQAWNKDTPVVVYCSNYICTASGAGAQQLQDAGFTKIMAYEAGMAAWHQAQLPTEGPAQESYLVAKVEAPAQATDTAHAVKEVSTEELHKMMQEAGLLN